MTNKYRRRSRKATGAIPRLCASLRAARSCADLTNACTYVHTHAHLFASVHLRTIFNPLLHREAAIYHRSITNVSELESAYSALWTQCQRCQVSGFWLVSSASILPRTPQCAFSLRCWPGKVQPGLPSLGRHSYATNAFASAPIIPYKTVAESFLLLEAQDRLRF